MIRYPVDTLWDELAFLAYHLHWSLDDLLDLEHGDRVQLLDSVARMNDRAWGALHDAEHR
jgi:hypothetical protein